MSANTAIQVPASRGTAVAVGAGLIGLLVIQALRSPYLLPQVKRLALALGGVVALQILLGIATLMSHVPISLGMAHQITAAILLAVSVAFAWRVRRP